MRLSDMNGIIRVDVRDDGELPVLRPKPRRETTLVRKRGDVFVVQARRAVRIGGVAERGGLERAGCSSSATFSVQAWCGRWKKPESCRAIRCASAKSSGSGSRRADRRVRRHFRPHTHGASCSRRGRAGGSRNWTRCCSSPAVNRGSSRTGRLQSRITDLRWYALPLKANPSFRCVGHRDQAQRA